MRLNFIETILETIVYSSWRSPWGIPGGTPEIRHKSSVNWTKWLNFPNRGVGKKSPEMDLEDF